MSAENIAVGSAVASAGWGIVSVVLKMPELAMAGGSGVIGALGIIQVIKAKIESRRDRKKP